MWREEILGSTLEKTIDHEPLPIATTGDSLKASPSKILSQSKVLRSSNLGLVLKNHRITRFIERIDPRNYTKGGSFFFMNPKSVAMSFK